MALRVVHDNLALRQDAGRTAPEVRCCGAVAQAQFLLNGVRTADPGVAEAVIELPSNLDATIFFASIMFPAQHEIAFRAQYVGAWPVTALWR